MTREVTHSIKYESVSYLNFNDIQNDLIKNQNFNYSVEYLLNFEKISKIISILKEKFDVIELIVNEAKNILYKRIFISFNGEIVAGFFINEEKNIETTMLLNVEVFFNLNSKSKEIIEKISKLFSEENIISSNNQIALTKLFLNKNGEMWESKPIFYSLDSFSKIRKEYYPYLNTDELFKQFLLSEENILIFTGNAGTGKTMLINLFLKYILENDRDEEEVIEAVYVKNEEILSLDSFWDFLNSEIPSIVILDDLDFYLTTRTSDVITNLDQKKNKFISHFLSFTDGLFRENKKVKFLITTNFDYSEIDPALLRKGRMFDILKLRELKNSEAKNIWKTYENLTEEEFETYFGTKENILPADLGSKISFLERKKKKQTETISYVLEDGISMFKKDTLDVSKIRKRKKKISLLGENNDN